MEMFLVHMSTGFNWILRTTWQTSVLICLVLLIQWGLRHRLNARVRHLLWLVVLIRMAMPAVPQSRLSIYNLLPDSLSQVHRQMLAAPAQTPSADKSVHPIGTEVALSPGLLPGTDITGETKTQRRQGFPLETHEILLCIWLIGAGLLSLYIFAQHIRFLRRVRSTCPVTHPKVLDLLTQCQRQVGTQIPIHLVTTDRIGGPALFGLIKPRLLLPTRTLAEMNHKELRYIFLHELVHLKYRDNLVNMIASALHVLHWFNPLIGYGFKRMRTDRELACDAKVLSLLHPAETAAYGDTIISQVELFLSSQPRPWPKTGFLGSRTQTKQRIAMISLFRKDRYRWSPLAIGLIGFLICIGLTDGYSAHQTHGKGLAPQTASLVITPGDLSSLIETSPPLRLLSPKTVYIRHQDTGKYLATDGITVTCNDSPGEGGLWEAHFDGEFTPDGDMQLFSVSSGMYLSTSGQGNLTVEPQTGPRTCWIRQAGPLGVKVISEAYEHGYLRLDEQGIVEAVPMGRDHLAYWDIVQLD